MTNKYLHLFKSKKNIEELKKEYRKLILVNHPDRGGSEEEAQLINTAYEKAYRFVENKENSGIDENYNNNFKKATKEDIKEFIEIFDKLIKMEGVEIDLVGSWIWLSGNTYFYKEEIKKLNFRFSKKHKKWYYFKNIEKSMKKRGSKKTYKQITKEYGVKKVGNRLAIA